MKLSLLMTTDTLICTWILVIAIAIIEISPHENEFLKFISVPYTYTDRQVPENLLYLPRGAKWRDVKNVLFSSSKCEKRKSAET